MPVRFRLLGDVSVAVPGGAVDLGPPRQRCVLAALLVDAGTPVPAGELVERVWGEHAPASADGTLRAYLSRLRGALANAPDVRLDHDQFGYVCRVDQAEVDLHLFRDLVDAAAATTDDERAATLFAEAFALWRGEPFGALHSPWLDHVRAVLTVQRLAARLDQIEVELRLGRHARLLGPLAEEVAAHPLEERLAAQYVVALYRNGQRAEALDHYQRFRRTLADELGVDPGPALRELHGRMLRSDPALDQPEQERPIPRQLPPDPQTFTGRDRELAAVAATIAGPGGVVAVVGPGGAGKTWLALRSAHQHADRFPDGQLYADLHGWSTAGGPAAPGTVVRGFLDALGVPPEAVPRTPDEQLSLYRSLLADKRMLVLLDNARDWEQASALLPGGPSTVVVTSRDHLAGLVVAHGVDVCTLDVLDSVAAEQLLVAHLGRARLDVDRAATTALLAAAGGLPLALAILAAQLAVRPGLEVRWLADELSAGGSPLDVFDDSHVSVSLRAVFATSVRALPPDARHAFRTLGVVDLPDVTVPSAAALLGTTAAATRSHLRELESAHLLQQHVPGRYRMHDLVRTYAAELGQDDPRGTRRRLVDHCLHAALAADRLLHPHRPAPVAPPAAAGPVTAPDDVADALRWFDDEHPGLLVVQRCAAENQWRDHAWQLAWAVHTYQRRRGLWKDNLAVWRTAVAVADHDPVRLAVAHRFLGLALVQSGEAPAALDHLDRSLRLAERLGDRRGQAHSHYALTQTLDQLDDPDRALTHATRTCDLYQDLDAPAEWAHSLNSLGWCHARRERLDTAARLCTRSLDLHRELGSEVGVAAALDSLGYIATRAGRHADAARYFDEAARVHEHSGDTVQLANVVSQLGSALHASGRTVEADRAWARAMTLYRSQQRIDEADRISRQRTALLHRPT